jgi:hypothetical protein
MGLAQRIKKGLTKMIPGDKITYVRKETPMTPAQRKKWNRGVAPTYKIPKTPKNSGIGWGP